MLIVMLNISGCHVCEHVVSFIVYYKLIIHFAVPYCYTVLRYIQKHSEELCNVLMLVLWTVHVFGHSCSITF